MATEYKVNGEMIRTLRKLKGWGGKELADAIDGSAQYIYRIERNEERPAFEKLLQISDALGVPFAILLENGHGNRPGVLKVGVLEFEVPADLIEPFIKLITSYNKPNR